MSLLADEFGISRKTLYQTLEAATQAPPSLISKADEPDVIITVGVDIRRTEHMRRFDKLNTWQKNTVIQEMTYCCQQLSNDNESTKLLEIIEQQLDNRHLASSAIERFNTALLFYLYVRKGAYQGFLTLFQAWNNLACMTGATAGLSTL